ncbi:MAG: hypothetical protein IJZ32_05250 [Clostridia bacterium]|nr:hypothetical protein [Clostridia bacterium]
MKKCILAVLMLVFSVFCFTFSSCIQLGENKGIGTSNYKMEDGENFIDSRAWVKYNAGKYNEYLGFIDTTGKILYSETLENQKTYNIGKGSGLIVTEETCKLINAKGEIVLTIDEKTEIKAYGGGYAWVYQNKSTITDLEHLYGVIDYQGNWVKPLVNLEEDDLYDKIKHIGNGFVGEIGRKDIVYPIYKGDNSIAITLNGVFSDWHAEFSNGMAFIPLSCHVRFASMKNGISITVTKRNEDGESVTEVYENIKDNCIIYEDGRVVNIGFSVAQLDYDWAFYDGKVVTRENEQYLGITDYTQTTPITTQFTAYPASRIEDFTFNGDYGLVQIRGLDEEKYVTMIDTQGNELIEPIKGKEVDDFILAPDGYAYYKQDDYYYIIDKNGNSMKTDITWFVKFSENIGVVKDDWYVLYYIKPNGEKLFDKLTAQ